MNPQRTDAVSFKSLSWKHVTSRLVNPRAHLATCLMRHCWARPVMCEKHRDGRMVANSSLPGLARHFWVHAPQIRPALSACPAHAGAWEKHRDGQMGANSSLPGLARHFWVHAPQIRPALSACPAHAGAWEKHRDGQMGANSSLPGLARHF